MIVKKIDFHSHVAWERGYLSQHTDEGLKPPMTCEDMRLKYDQLGIEKGVALPLVSPEAMSDQHSNFTTRLCYEYHPETVGWWFCNVDPRWLENSPEADFSGIFDYYKSLGAKGIGELTANLPVLHPMMLNLFAQAEQADLPILFHIGYPQRDYGIIDDVGLYGIEKVLQNYPNLMLIAHSQKWWAEISSDCTAENRNTYPEGKVTPGRAVELLRKYPNLYADLSAGSGENAMRRDPEFAYGFLEEFQDKLLFGMDCCAMVEEINLSGFLDEAVENGHISQTAFNKICRENALRLLGPARE